MKIQHDDLPSWSCNIGMLLPAVDQYRYSNIACHVLYGRVFVPTVEKNTDNSYVRGNTSYVEDTNFYVELPVSCVGDNKSYVGLLNHYVYEIISPQS